MDISLKSTERSNPQQRLRKRHAHLFVMMLLVLSAACKTSYMEIKDVPLPPQAKPFVSWKDDSAADDEYVKADKRIQNALGSNAQNLESKIFFLDKPTSAEEIARFYDEQLGKRDFKRGADLPLAMDNAAATRWEKKGWFGEQSIVTAFIGVSGEGEQNLLIIYNLKKNG